MQFFSTIILVAAGVSQALASPVPKESTAAELAAINADLHTKYGNLLAEKDACIAAAADADEQEQCVSRWHNLALGVAQDRFSLNPEGSAEYQLARGRIDFHWKGIFPDSDGFFLDK